MGARYKPQAYDTFATSGYIENGHHYFVDAKGSRRADSYIGVTTSMLFSHAFNDLSAKQRQLYLIAIYQNKSAADRPHKHHGDEYKDKSYIYLNWRLIEQFDLYKKNNQGFYKDLKALQEHGFLIPVFRENNQRTIYRLIDAWKDFQQGQKYQEINQHSHRWEWVRVSY